MLSSAAVPRLRRVRLVALGRVSGGRRAARVRRRVRIPARRPHLHHKSRSDPVHHEYSESGRGCGRGAAGSDRRRRRRSRGRFLVEECAASELRACRTRRPVRAACRRRARRTHRTRSVAQVSLSNSNLLCMSLAKCHFKTNLTFVLFSTQLSFTQSQTLDVQNGISICDPIVTIIYAVHTVVTAEVLLVQYILNYYNVLIVSTLHMLNHTRIIH